jgi:predicted nucleic acid-binding protein
VIVLDTTVLIDHLRGRPAAQRVVELAIAGETLATTAINIEEVMRGLRPSEEAAAETLFDGLMMIALGRDEGRQAGLWRRQFAGRGVTLSQADCLIAAAAFLAGARLATGNPSDFPMPGLTVEEWPVGG